MSSKKQKIPKISEQQYNAYIAALRGDAALYNPDGSLVVPPALQPEKEENPLQK
jgi:hypothetical protein